jgi:methanogenic corrinoid protein MtbC1
VPNRVGRGRSYESSHIERLLLLSQLVSKGHAIGQIASLGDRALQHLIENEPIGQKTAPAEADLISAILTAVEAFDSAAARDELSRLAAVLSPRDLVYQVAVPLMHEVGNRWHEGRMAVAQEHLIFQILRNLLGSLMHHFRPADGPIKMVLATPPEEFHEFGILAAATLASMNGIAPVYLGPNLPPQEIAGAAKRTGSTVVVLGITTPSTTTVDDVRSVADSIPPDSRLWIGGAGAAHLDLSGPLLLEDLSGFENECLRLRARV